MHATSLKLATQLRMEDTWFEEEKKQTKIEIVTEISIMT